MKKTFYFAMILVAVTAISCKKTQKQANQAKTEVIETVSEAVEAFDDEHGVEDALDYNGVYEGSIPTANNEVLSTVISLAFDNTFTKKTIAAGKGATELNEKGNFKLEEGTIGLYFEDGKIEYYQIGEGHLRMLDKDKNQIGGDLSEAYVLTQTEIFNR